MSPTDGHGRADNGHGRADSSGATGAHRPERVARDCTADIVRLAPLSPLLVEAHARAARHDAVRTPESP